MSASSGAAVAVGSGMAVGSGSGVGVAAGAQAAKIMETATSSPRNRELRFITLFTPFSKGF